MHVKPFHERFSETSSLKQNTFLAHSLLQNLITQPSMFHLSYISFLKCYGLHNYETIQLKQTRKDN